MQAAWVLEHQDAPLYMHIAVGVGVLILSILIAYALLKALDEHVRNWLTEHWLKRSRR